MTDDKLVPLPIAAIRVAGVAIFLVATLIAGISSARADMETHYSDTMRAVAVVVKGD